MIFTSLNQLNIIFIFIFCGILIGFISSFVFIIFLKKHQKKLIKIIFDSIFYAFLSFFYVVLLNFLNFGKFSVSLLLSFIAGYKWSTTLLNKSVVFFERKCYNKFNNKMKSFYSLFKKRKKQKDEVQKHS